MTKQIYMDHSATTPVDSKVLEAMLPYFAEDFGNASSLHSFGLSAKSAMETARQKVAGLISAHEEEIIFTAGGTESDNIAIKGIALKNKEYITDPHGPHIITSAIEHPAVLETCKYLETQGFKVEYLPVDKHGMVSVSDVEKAIGKNTFLISIMHANNDIGTIEPIKEIGKIAGERDILFHTDAVQTVGKIPINVDEMNIDLLSISSHKIYGPKGVGALYIRKGVQLEAFTHGGGHEKGIRSSTENTPGIVGLGKACELAKERLLTDNKHLTELRDRLTNNILSEIEESYLDGHPTKRLPNNTHFRFAGIEGESLVLALDEKGIAASTGSACSSKKLTPSHVLLAIGLSIVEAHGSLRLTLGRGNTKEDVDYVVSILPDVVKRLRAISPIWQKSIETDKIEEERSND